ncbi:MAG: isoprenylcysteine carboxylmethyltransferase family protein [Candidatus Obscuribacterales bacterium]|nr:isoprenylcysteine carboxylmethyltransferase family protein [Candidatus Obscuribacterales bacterium]
MEIYPQTVCTAALAGLGAILSAPVLYRGFKRRGTGVFYEQNYLIQRAPQYSTLLTVIVVVASFLAGSGLFGELGLMILAPLHLAPEPVWSLIAWLGVLEFCVGLVFMIGGWYSLGECFTTDAEVLDGHKVRKNGLLAFVMHPAYSGIIQSVLGAAMAAVSPLAILLTLFLVAPLWLNRAKYEEALLLESLGPEYKEYAEEMKWRRLVPKFFPIGV